ncbi:VWA domain-containing protein [Flavobacterium sp. H122]|uniref:vWA domain-containing protein n=1 Tax=Flavobacterium sp. H122 TaxID=2529860 RepID=UPI0010AA7CEA|nr:VWA domain-containing protein [Flavobacterium sp. H122]
MKSVKLISLAIALLISFLSLAQEKTITGVVSDASGPIPGVNVVVKGTTRGVQTGFDGMYSIKASEGEKLVFSFMGMKEIIRTVGTSNIINVVMQDDSKKLSEVVVTAYGVSSEDGYYAAPRRTKKSKAEKKPAPMVSGLAVKYEKDSRIVIKGNKNNDKKPISNGNEDYGVLIENDFESPKRSPLSTFSIDVDNASYTNVRRFINNGQKVPTDAVRVEEMINFFKYNYSQPKEEHPFAMNTEYSDCPWNAENKLVRIALQGKNIPTDNLPNSNMVFLIDVSGSMSSENKLPLLIQSMKILVHELRTEDKVSIVVYAGAAGLVLPPTPGNKKETIIDALEKLQAGGSTAGGEGIKLAYKIAEENFIKNGNNRVILATDGDFNVGASSDNDMQRLIEEKRKSGVFLTCLGYGMGNYKDSKMETLANKGNGNYAYIDNIQEAKRFLSKEFKGSMFTIAKDVKIQIEFNPNHVQAYRLIGYENRKLRAEDFTNDAIDAGELGSGHTVTALYEIVPVGVKSKFFDIPSDLKYSKPETNVNNYSDELATIKFRYKKPDGDKSIEMAEVIANNSKTIENSSNDFKFVTAVAWFGLKLRDSKLIKEKGTTDIASLARKGIDNDVEGYKAELVRLIESCTNF